MTLATMLLATTLAIAGFSGIDLVERPEGLMVWRITPGPLDGNILTSTSLARGDLLISIDGRPATLDAWRFAHAQPAGSTMVLEYREGSPRGWRGVPAPGGTLQTTQVSLSEPDVWTGLLKSGDLPPLDASLEGARTANQGCAAECATALANLGPTARARGEKLLGALAVIPERFRDPGTSALLRAIFRAPQKSEDLVRSSIPPTADWLMAPHRAAARLTGNLAGLPSLALPEAHGTFEIAHSDAAVWYLDFLLNGARSRFAELVTDLDANTPGLRPLVEERLASLLVRGPNAAASMQALRLLPKLPPREAARIIAHLDVVANVDPELAKSEPIGLPEALVGAVEGTILNASEIAELGWVIVGGAGANTYDLGRIAAVFDIGGDDTYRWSPKPGAHRAVVDLAGNDTHLGGDGANALGPGAAIGALAFVDDYAGDDRYAGGSLTFGAVLGVSVLVDRAGNDHYSGGSWSLGAAAGGAATVVDLSGDDRWKGEGMAIGVGGPLGVGAVVDLAGDDRAELGTRPSVYGVAGEHAGFGLGLGLGFRFAAAGGVGAYLDLAGNDTRRSGEFSQGCGYFLGLGILVDASGNDDSSADRYGIGSATHQGIGVALDFGGNDAYLGRTAAHLGGAWDESIAFFLDIAGDDRYAVDELSLGGAANQALAIMIDRAGADHYAGAGATLGAASSNDYHFADTGLGSLALFLDLDGIDAYPTGRANDSVTLSGEVTTAECTGLDSVFIDRTAKPSAE
jgi:hypothetical protein